MLHSNDIWELAIQGNGVQCDTINKTENVNMAPHAASARHYRRGRHRFNHSYSHKYEVDGII